MDFKERKDFRKKALQGLGYDKLQMRRWESFLKGIF
jgi:hypothetical protein